MLYEAYYDQIHILNLVHTACACAKYKREMSMNEHSKMYCIICIVFPLI